MPPPPTHLTPHNSYPLTTGLAGERARANMAVLEKGLWGCTNPDMFRRAGGCCPPLPPSPAGGHITPTLMRSIEERCVVRGRLVPDVGVDRGLERNSDSLKVALEARLQEVTLPRQLGLYDRSR